MKHDGHEATCQMREDRNGEPCGAPCTCYCEDGQHSQCWCEDCSDDFYGEDEDAA